MNNECAAIEAKVRKDGRKEGRKEGRKDPFDVRSQSNRDLREGVKSVKSVPLRKEGGRDT